MKCQIKSERKATKEENINYIKSLGMAVSFKSILEVRITFPTAKSALEESIHVSDRKIQN